MSIYGKDFITTQDFSDEEIQTVLDLALKMKKNRNGFSHILSNRSFLLFFFNPSFRTRVSFETGVTELGGHAQYMTPTMGRFRSGEQVGENIEDMAKVLSRYVAGVGIRIEDAGTYYGAAHEMLKEYARWLSIPLINMADDRFHPCQGLADIMGWAEWFGDGNTKPNYQALRGKTLLLTWGSGYLHRSKTSPQSTLLLASRYGMNIKIAHPTGYKLDREVMKWVNKNCKVHQSKFSYIDNPYDGYEGVDVVYSRHWISEEAYFNGSLQKQVEIEKAQKQSKWILTADKMARTNNALFTHPMPVDRNHEVEDAVASGHRSAIYDIAENRLHIQKAIMALTMGKVE